LAENCLKLFEFFPEALALMVLRSAKPEERGKAHDQKEECRG
jgi:hypothetical protein